MQTWLFSSPWTGLILWMGIYISDYYMTLATARLYRKQDNLKFEGSFELTPQFQKDIDNARPFSVLHILILVLSSLLLLMAWFSSADFRSFYHFILGMLILLEVAVHMRHLKNLYTISTTIKNGGISGTIEYRRWLMYKNSAFELFLFGILFALTAMLEGSWFFVGGAFSCFITSFRHWVAGNKFVKQAAQQPPTKVADP